MSEGIEQNDTCSSGGRLVSPRFVHWNTVVRMLNLSFLFNKYFGKCVAAPKEGRWKEFNKHAILIAEGNYVNDSKHGHWQEFYDTGESMLEENYEHGVMHGRFASYHPNGIMHTDGRYVDGKREGHFKVYDDTGRQIKSMLFIKNNLIGEVILNVDLAYESS